MNVSPLMGMALSHDKALAGPLNTVLNVEALHDIIEVILVDAHNRRILEKARERKARAAAAR